MIITLLNHRFIMIFLLLFLINAVHAQEPTTVSNEPATTSESIESESTSSEAATDSEPADTEQATQDAPKSDTEKDSENTSKNKGEITRAQFTTAIVDREPTDDVVMLTNDNDKIYFFTELVGFNGQTIKHRWEYEGKKMAEVDFKVDGSRWRVHSSKNIKPEWTGVWNVIVYDQNNNPLKISSFEVVDANTSGSQ